MRIETKIQAIGVEGENCENCNKRFKRGQAMYGAVYDDGDPAGWWCDACVSVAAEIKKTKPSAKTRRFAMGIPVKLNR